MCHRGIGQTKHSHNHNRTMVTHATQLLGTMDELDEENVHSDRLRNLGCHRRPLDVHLMRNFEHVLGDEILLLIEAAALTPPRQLNLHTQANQQHDGQPDG